MELGEYDNALQYLLKAHQTGTGNLIRKVSELEHSIGVCYQLTDNQEQADYWFKESKAHNLKASRKP